MECRLYPLLKMLDTVLLLQFLLLPVVVTSLDLPFVHYEKGEQHQIVAEVKIGTPSKYLFYYVAMLIMVTVFLG